MTKEKKSKKSTKDKLLLEETEQKELEQLEEESLDFSLEKVEENNESMFEELDPQPCRSKRGVLKTSPIAKFLPNTITIIAMCFGLLSMRFAHRYEGEYAVLCILVAALLDMFDGKVARYLDQSSQFGLQLDSLSDLICFGVAPSYILYTSSMQTIGKFGWGICMFYTVCCALRLARFNVTHSCTDKADDINSKYFTGVPAPLGALVALFPLILFFELDDFSIVKPVYASFFLVFSGCLMVSTVRTFSSKIIEINNTKTWVTLTVIAFLVICLATKLWLFLSLLIIIYIFSIPYGVFEYSKALEELKADKE